MFILKIAWRSLLRHKAKSIIIGTILFLGALIMTLGNATAIGMQRGVEKNMVESFTGHIILVSDEETKDNVLFTPLAKPLKILKDYEKIRSVLDKQDFIKGYLPMTTGRGRDPGRPGDGLHAHLRMQFRRLPEGVREPRHGRRGRACCTMATTGILLNVDGRKNRYKNAGLLARSRGAAG